MSQENIPWHKLSPWQARWIQSTLDFQKKFNCTLPPNCFSMLVCKDILRKVNRK